MLKQSVPQQGVHDRFRRRNNLRSKNS